MIEVEWSHITIIISYILCTFPSNYLIRRVFQFYNIVDSSTDDLKNAGRVIGALERMLTLTFIILGEYEAVGFLIAAKSILRYKEGDTQKTEYVLVGTMLSILIAIGLAILALELPNWINSSP